MNTTIKAGDRVRRIADHRETATVLAVYGDQVWLTRDNSWAFTSDLYKWRHPRLPGRHRHDGPGVTTRRITTTPLRLQTGLYAMWFVGFACGWLIFH